MFFEADLVQKLRQDTDGECRFNPPLLLDKEPAFPRVISNRTWCGKFNKDVTIKKKTENQVKPLNPQNHYT